MFSLAGFTPDAADWAEGAGVALFRFDMQGEPEPVNGHARQLMTFATPKITPKGWRGDLARLVDEFQETCEENSRALTFAIDAERAVGPEADKKKTVAYALLAKAQSKTAPVGDHPSRVDSEPAPLARAVRCIRGG